MLFIVVVFVVETGFLCVLCLRLSCLFVILDYYVQMLFKVVFTVVCFIAVHCCSMRVDESCEAPTLQLILTKTCTIPKT